MFTFFVILDALLFIMLLLVAAVFPAHSQMSQFELQRRAKAGDGDAIKKIRREALLETVESLQNIKISILLVLITAISIVAFGWIFGVLLSIFIALSYELLASVGFIHKLAQKIYKRYEPTILSCVEKYPRFFKLFGRKQHHLSVGVHSKEELQHLINQAHFLEAGEKNALIATIHFSNLQVKDVMTVKKNIKSIGQNEMLGPLVLDQLHKTGYGYFPVINGSLDNIVGILDIKDSMSLKDKKSHMVKTVMSQSVHLVNKDQPAEEVLSDFLRHRSHLFIVVDEHKETEGIVSLQDIVKALLGRTAHNTPANIKEREES